MASVCTLPPFRFDDLPWHHPLTPCPLRGWACRRHCWPPPLPCSHPLCRPGRRGCRQRRGVPAPPASRIGSGAVPPMPAWVQRGLCRPHRCGRTAATGVSLLLPLACAKGRAREVGGGVCLPLLRHGGVRILHALPIATPPPLLCTTVGKRSHNRGKGV